MRDEMETVRTETHIIDLSGCLPSLLMLLVCLPLPFAAAALIAWLTQ